jgi:hypothetical protein
MVVYMQVSQRCTDGQRSEPIIVEATAGQRNGRSVGNLLRRMTTRTAGFT